ncbi:hypothetical protein DDV21_010305 [Streptococcus chenjunshii]|uniref:Uncharacterized protein n=1 Tax=Streptococcus chenjunshii TaxID=2173853 RepID=A0A372KLP1_9STRE|nr:hypothetical protein [Streptococcus chenjunshii]AXQ79439.1 hypothetical protein DDV21_010305 [Streptococcus chenjunshii]RFU51103.1 hypothetical protein DDV22_05195 [Streptococcus chenjunshii]RFU53201.1 hypothetical protein DDV23_05705 [Streptococcus chenjunshii]
MIKTGDIVTIKVRVMTDELDGNFLGQVQSGEYFNVNTAEVVDKRVKWSQDDIDYLILAYQDGESTLDKIADFLGRTRSAVTQKAYQLRRSGLIDTARLNGWTKRELQELINYHGKLTNKEIAQQLGKSLQAIEHKITTLGIAKWVPTDIEKVKKLAAQGLTREQIANKLDVDIETVKRIVRKHDIKVQPAENYFQSGHRDFVHQSIVSIGSSISSR